MPKYTKLTAESIKPANLNGIEPEFVRIPQLFPLSGIKRGIAYRKIEDGTFKSVLLREPGNIQGVRLIYWPSVKAYLHRLMEEQEKAASATVNNQGGLQ